MLKQDSTTIILNGTTTKWYKSKGYKIPLHDVQLYCKNKNGDTVKNGTKSRPIIGAKLTVKISDLMPGSNVDIIFICDTCRKEYSTTWQSYNMKSTNNCRDCQSKIQFFKGGHHEWWVKKLITNNPDAKCNISGETDKRFLVLHHLLNRSSGGASKEFNYVILSANYHMAFHRSMGGLHIPCSQEDYIKFKLQEQQFNG